MVASVPCRAKKIAAGVVRISEPLPAAWPDRAKRPASSRPSCSSSEAATSSAIWVSSVNSPGSRPSDPPPHISVFEPRAGEGKRAGELPRWAELERCAEGVTDRGADERAGDPVGAVHGRAHDAPRGATVYP
jgi:hypothetical protein